MFRIDSLQVNWYLVVILVALALMLAMVSSSVSADVPQSKTVTAAMDGLQKDQLDAKQARSQSELWYIARELYRAGRVVEARQAFEQVLEAYPCDRAARWWAGMAAYRTSDHTEAIQYWSSLHCEAAPVGESGVWPSVALAVAELERGNLDRAALFILPLERGDFGFELTDHPIVSFVAARIYEQLASTAPVYRDAVEDDLAEKLSPAVAATGSDELVSPNSRSWLIFLTKRAMQRAARGAWSIDRDAPVVTWSATIEPSLAPTVGELLECIGVSDFATQARRKLKVIDLYESPPRRHMEIYDDTDFLKRGRFIA